MAEILEKIKEIWKSIINYEGLYEISNFGRIKSLIDNHTYCREKILKPNRQKSGHLYIKLCKNNIHKTLKIHRLVLETFVGPCLLGMECRHLDGNPENNNVENLKWGTSKENKQDSIKHRTNKLPDNKGSKNGMAKLNNWKVRIINRLLEDNYLTQKEISRLFDISQPTVSEIKNGEKWS